MDLLDILIWNKLKNKKGGGITPTGTINITENGEHNVTTYATANVAVPQPSGSISITTNGEHDVTSYVTANVAVPQPSGSISITTNGEHNVKDYETAIVNVDPYEYYDYIQASGTQYINSLFIPVQYANTFVAECEMQLIQNANNADTSAVGTGTFYMGWRLSYNQVVFAPNGTANFKSIPVDYTTKHKFYINCLTGKYGYDSNEYTFTPASPSSSGSGFYLFGYAPQYLFSCKIYYLKIYNGYEQDGVTPRLVKHLVPAKRKANNQVGMVDMVTGNFFINEGIGEFTLGNEE